MCFNLTVYPVTLTALNPGFVLSNKHASVFDTFANNLILKDLIDRLSQLSSILVKFDRLFSLELLDTQGVTQK